MIPERLSRLRREMEQRRIDVYVVPTADFHESEYVGAHFKARSYITGFTGSAGTAIITMTEAGLWTDARYFLQAKHQLENTGVTLYRMGEEGVPTIMEYLRSALPEGGTLGFDGRVINARLGAEFLALAEEKNAKLAVGEDLVGIIWDDRPELPHAPVRILTAEYSGRSTADKLADVRAEMKKQGASVHLLTSLYDIAWLLNVRGGDIDYVPVVLSYLALTEEQCLWFVQDAVLTDELRAYLAENRIETRPYESFYDYAAAIPAGETVLLDKGVCNYRLVSELCEGVEIVDETNPSVLMKSIKNETEQKNTVNAHIKDGVAVTKFIYWLKKNIGKTPMTELSASDYLAARRALITDRALEPRAGDPHCGGTIYLCTADREGNMVSFIQSNYTTFGAGVAVPGTGISLQNRGANFSLDPASDNCLAGGKRSYHTIIPGFLLRDGAAVGPFGVMGAFMQPQGQTEVLVNTLDYHMNPQEALDAPRIQWIGGRRLELEREAGEAIADELRAMGHEVTVVDDRISMGRGQIIWRGEDGVYTAGTEPRCDGAVAAW